MSIKHPLPPAGLVLPYAAQLLLLNLLIAEEYLNSCWFLFDGSVTPSLGDTTYTYLTHQVTWPGIGNPTATVWGDASIGSSSAAVSYADTLAWTFNDGDGSRTIGGAFALDSSGNLLGAELIINGPVILNMTGLVLPFQPAVSFGSRYPSLWGN